jgi:hypothetical protein
MKAVAVSFVLLLTSFSSFAATKFRCTTISDEGNYIKTYMDVTFLSKQKIVLQPYDSEMAMYVSRGGKNKIAKPFPSGWMKYTGFDSEETFGDLSQSIADKNISFYASPAVLSGNRGEVVLHASGTVNGYEKGRYICVKK